MSADTSSGNPREMTLIDRFESIARERADDLAVVSPFGASSFSEIDAWSNRIGHAIAACGDDGPVGLITEDVAHLVASMVGVLRAGRCWVILDPRTPADRLRQIVADADLGTLLFDEAFREVAEQSAPSKAVLVSSRTIESASSERFLVRKRRKSEAAAITYTSGSTGSPKGVVHSDEFVLEQADLFAHLADDPMETDDRLLFTGATTTGGALGPVLGSVLSGATLQPFPAGRASLLELARWMIEQKTTIWMATPVLFRRLMMTIDGEILRFPDLRQVRLAGDVVTRRDLDLFQEQFEKGCSMRIGYGSSECGAIAVNIIRASNPVEGTIVPVGRPLGHLEVRLVDEQGREVATGKTGEIVVTGSRLASGYWRPGPADEGRFIRDRDREDRTTYFTGDLGRFDERHSLYFCGRKDNQLKVRGFRLEPVEVEAVLRTHAAVSDAAVIGIRREDGDLVLRAFVTTIGAVEPSELRMHVARALPGYMVPSTISIVDEIPLVPGGKVDRKALETRTRVYES